MVDRSAGRASMPDQDPATVVRRIVKLRWRRRLGPVQIAGELGMPASTVHAVLVRCRINRLSRIDRVTGEPIRRYEHDHPGSMIHVDVTKFGNIPDGGGWRFVGQQQGKRNRSATAQRTGEWTLEYRHAASAPRSCTPSSTTTPASPTSRSARTRRPRPRSECCGGPSPGSPNAASPSNGCSPTTVATAHSPGATPAPNSASRPNAPAPTDRRRTGRSSDSTAPSPTAGPTPASTPQRPNAEPHFPAGCTSTITTGATPRSAATPISRLNNLPGHHNYGAFGDRLIGRAAATSPWWVWMQGGNARASVPNQARHPIRPRSRRIDRRARRVPRPTPGK